MTNQGFVAFSLGLLVMSCTGTTIPIGSQASSSSSSGGVNTPRPAPNIMFVVDRSGSMEDNAEGVPGTCESATGAYSGRGNDCKWNNLLDVLLGPAGGDGGFIAALDAQFNKSNDSVRLGLTNFSGSSNDPTSTADACSTGQVLVTVGAGNESEISSQLLQTIPAGGTPTAATLAILTPAYPALDPSASVQRANYLILLTDGAPNCNANFQASASNCSGDQCTLGSCAAADWNTSDCACFQQLPPGLEVIPQGCLDQDAAVQAVAALNSGSNPIKTFVIGFGSVTTAPDATATLNQMGMAGGMNLSSGSGYSFYQASSASDLQAALNAVLGIMTNG